MTLRVQLVFVGEPFNRDAVMHTLRHVAMRADWQLTFDANVAHRVIYATTDQASAIEARSNDVVILSSRAVAEHLQSSRAPIPLAVNRLPFPHPIQRSDWICADVIAGAYAAMNLWYEERTRVNVRNGWITWREDWMARAGFDGPVPLVDEWLLEIARAAMGKGWYTSRLHDVFTIVLTHDVDYLPSKYNRGLPRLVRAIARQIVLRRRPADVLRLLTRYMLSRQPYFLFDDVMRAEANHGACSSFQLVSTNEHRLDPTYEITHEPILSTLQRIAASDWEIALHGSYMASRVPAKLRDERLELERASNISVQGHRQHYLNFHPSQLFDAIECAKFEYDSSVGYNDVSGARAGTFFPYRPFGVNHRRAYNFWEIPFVLMDTTLATTNNFSPRQALVHSQKILAPVAQACGTVAIIWHLEQLSGLLDPGFECVYFDLLDWIRAQGGVMTTGRAVVRNWNARWKATCE